MDLQEQLAELRKRIARIDSKYANVKPPEPPAVTPVLSRNLPDGHEVETPLGRHWEMERTWERHRRHGSVGIVDLADLPDDLLDAISAGTAPSVSPLKWCFLDTETTGLAGGSGTYAFLVGVGRIDASGFHLKQFLMRDYGEEASLLHSLSAYLADFDVLVTYNGRTYDQPLLETRYRMARARPPFERLAHVDLLYGARRLWNLRFDSCRLMELESQILGVEREGDLPGHLIPNVYFEYLRSQETFRLVPIFHHNALDILTLACLTAIVPWAFRSPADAPLHHGAEMVGLGRWLRRAERHEDALILFRRALQKNMPDALMFRTMWDIAELERKLDRLDASLAGLTELAGCNNPFQSAALEMLAKHYEHRVKNYAIALEMTSAALALCDTPELRHREQRLRKKLERRSVHPRLI